MLVSVTDYQYDDSGVRVEQTVQVDSGTPVATTYHIDPQNHTGYACPFREAQGADLWLGVRERGDYSVAGSSSAASSAFQTSGRN
jgi:hypothetical protein